MKKENTFIVRPETTEQENALKAFVKALKMKFEVAEDPSYAPEFVEKIQESRKQANNGETVTMELDDIWKEQ